jgi:hypothetical protein
MIVQLTAREATLAARENLGIAPKSATDLPLDDEFIAASLRRIAGFHCPCSPATLRTVLLESLDSLVPDRVALQGRVEHVLEAMHVVGDLLELSQVTVADDSTPRTWAFAAPPSFVARTDTIFNILGLAAEDSLPLPQSLKSRVRLKGASRVLQAEVDEDIRSQLLAAGFQEQSLETWLRLPRLTTPTEYVRQIEAQLAAKKPSGEIDELRIIDTNQHTLSYRKRWTAPTLQSGRYVCRRAQAYGADIWGYVELAAGRPEKLLDFPLTGSTYRGCDEAWRLQMALDQASGHPQKFQARQHADGVLLTFDSPLPLWMVRRLETVGDQVSFTGALLAFLISRHLVAPEIEYLTSRLGLNLTT